MYYTSHTLEKLYDKYDILNLRFGVIGDKLGDLFEEYIVSCLESRDNLSRFTSKNTDETLRNLDFEIFSKILNLSCSNEYKLSKINATSNVENRTTGGPPKTDVIADVFFDSKEKFSIPLSIKQTTAKKVAFAEFDVNTIVKEVGIKDKRLIHLLNKHQTDASAKNFTSNEKLELKELLKPIARKFVRWVVTGTTEDTDDLKTPRIIVKFQLEKGTYKIKDYHIFTINEYIDHIMLNAKGIPKRGGFGTGLSWTYATGSKGKKIQFKG